MADKLDLPDIGTLGNPITARAAINTNFTTIETAFDNTLSRDGTTPNQMEADIDLNDNDLLNVKRIDADEIYKNGVPFSQEVAYANKRYETFVGTGSQDEFTLAEDPGSLGNLAVSIDGVVQVPGVDFNYVGTQLTFVAAPALNSVILVRYDEAVPTGITNALAVIFDAPDIAALSQSVGDILTSSLPGIPVTLYATPAQLAIDASVATQRAINYAISSGRNAVYFPGGVTYRFLAASAALDPGTDDICFFGDGESSLLIFEEGTSVAANVEDRKNLFKNIAAGPKGRIEFRDLHFRGTWSDAGYPTGQGGSALMLYNYELVVITGCIFENLRSYVTVCEYNKNVRVTNNTFDKNARDNCRFRSSFNVIVTHNHFAHCDDDAVALHCNTNVTGGDIREGIVVSNNIFEDCPAVQILGGRMVTVCNNILRRCKQNGILVYSSAGAAAEADNSQFGIDVSHNQIYDMLNDNPFATAVSQCIAVYSRPAEAVSGSVIPGTNIVATGAFVLPWNHRNGQYDSATDGVPPQYFVRVQNNTIVRTLPAVGAYTTWGYGSTYAGDGPKDPAVTEAALRPGTGILISGQGRKTIVSGNVISHVSSCISFFQEAGSNFGLDDVIINDNNLSDFNGSCISLVNPGSARHVNLIVRDNAIDGDPYHISTNRGTNGTWLADTSPAVITAVSYFGVVLRGNKIRNVARVVDNSGGTGLAAYDNTLRCEPTVTGFNVANQGIGNCPDAGPSYTYEIADSDPTSATYGNLLTSVQPTSAAMPATGFYVRGTLIRSTDWASNFGWLRLVTGNAHVAGTDWKRIVLT